MVLVYRIKSKDVTEKVTRVMRKTFRDVDAVNAITIMSTMTGSIKNQFVLVLFPETIDQLHHGNLFLIFVLPLFVELECFIYFNLT